MEFSKYILQFAKNTETWQTHLSFNKGKYNVPDEKYDEFYQKYFAAMRNGEILYLIEKVHGSDFAFFMDIDVPRKTSINLGDEHIKTIINNLNEAITEMFTGDATLTQNIVSKRENKYHLNYYNLNVDSTGAKALCRHISEKLDSELFTCIDQSVYRTGLRLLGACKPMNTSVYKVYDLQSGKYVNNIDFETFMKTVVRRKQDVQLSPMSKSVVVQKAVVKGIDNENTKITEEITSLLSEVKLSNECFANVDMTVEKVFARQNKLGMFCYYVSIADRMCPFKARHHQRASNPVYVEIGMNGVCMKCHDEDCLRRKYPEEGVKLPDDFAMKYSQTYLSMSTKYWKTDVSISAEKKKQLEESLTGSHFQVAKTAFSIYKDRFRIDDVKNSTWYEYDGVRWKPSHVMNILISEDLPRYYKGIKISDTSAVKDTNLQKFLVNDEKIDQNLRNQMVDMVTSKLENVGFKNNVLNQLTYLFKNHDPDFYTNLDTNPMLLGFKNGVYDFEENVFRQAKPRDYITYSTGYDFIEYDETLPQIAEIYDFLSKIITNVKVRNYLLKVLGKSLVGIPDEKFYIWTGISGANGKSTLVNFLESTLGEYITSVDVSLLTNRRANGSNASPDIVRLRGKRMFTFQEPEHDDRLRTGILKQFTGGDTIIARELFKAPITFKLQGTMIMCCNDLPSVASIDGGTFRRIRVIEFGSRFCDNPVKDNEFRIDPSLKYKLPTWRPYFMSILIHWYNKYLYEGLNEPDEVKKATDKYKNDNDKFNEYIDKCVEENSHNFENIKSIYSHFQSWWSDNYPIAKMPELKEVRRALKIKYGNEKEKVQEGTVVYGFNVSLTSMFNHAVAGDDDC
jgi:P4 family phage/plasmid primase-like protien